MIFTNYMQMSRKYKVIEKEKSIKQQTVLLLKMKTSKHYEALTLQTVFMSGASWKLPSKPCPNTFTQ